MDLQVILNETVCTFLFVSVILMVKGKHTAGDRRGIGAAIVVVSTLMCMISGTNSLGASFNPAVSVALTTNSVLYYDPQSYMYHYLYAYMLGPYAGGLLAGLFHLWHAKGHAPEDKQGQYAQQVDHDGLLEHK
jgi:glycerol uptake facilitator-like aquaporin